MCIRFVQMAAIVVGVEICLFIRMRLCYGATYNVLELCLFSAEGALHGWMRHQLHDFDGKISNIFKATCRGSGSTLEYRDASIVHRPQLMWGERRFLLVFTSVIESIIVSTLVMEGLCGGGTIAWARCSSVDMNKKEKGRDSNHMSLIVQSTTFSRNHLGSTLEYTEDSKVHHHP